MASLFRKTPKLPGSKFHLGLVTIAYAAVTINPCAAELVFGTISQISAAASTLAGNLMTNYNPSDGGVLNVADYGWWESGGMWATMIQYAHSRDPRPMC